MFTMKTSNVFLNGIFYLAKESYDKGDEYAVHVIELLGYYLKARPNHVIARMLYGDSLRFLGRTNDALSELMQVFDKATGKLQVHAAVSIAQLMKDHESRYKAKKWYKIATDLSDNLETDDDGWLWVMRGANLAALGEFRNAIMYYKVAINKKNVDQEEVLLNLGLAYRALGKYNKAIKWFLRALAIQSDYKKAQDALSGIKEIYDTISLVTNPENK
jgi:tetratricopeptide (TPR) repeat protein